MSVAALTAFAARLTALLDAGWTITGLPDLPDELRVEPPVHDGKSAGRAGIEKREADLFKYATWLKSTEAYANSNATIAPYNAVKHVGGTRIERTGVDLAQLLDVCEGFDADQARLKPEFRLGYVAVVRGEGRSDENTFGAAA